MTKLFFPFQNMAHNNESAPSKGIPTKLFWQLSKDSEEGNTQVHVDGPMDEPMEEPMEGYFSDAEDDTGGETTASGAGDETTDGGGGETTDGGVQTSGSQSKKPRRARRNNELATHRKSSRQLPPKGILRRPNM